MKFKRYLFLFTTFSLSLSPIILSITSGIIEKINKQEKQNKRLSFPNPKNKVKKRNQKISIKKMKKTKKSVFKTISFDDTPKHIFYLMIDSLTSARLFDSYNLIKSRLTRIQSEIDANRNVAVNKTIREKLKIKLSALDGFNLKMNVVSSGYGTASTIGSIIGGPNHASPIQEFRRKTETRKNQMQKLWNGFLEDIGNNDNIQKIYLNTLNYYEVKENSRGNWANVNFSNLDKINISKKAKDKLVLESNGNRNEYYKPSFILDILDKHGEQIKKENNVFYITTEIVHDIFNDWNYDYKYPPFGSQKDIFDTLVAFKNKLKDLGIYKNSEIMIVSDHGKQINSYEVLKETPEQSLEKLFLSSKYEQYNAKKYEEDKEWQDGYYFEKDEFFSSSFSNDDIFGANAPLATMVSILYKPIDAKEEKLTVDWNNLYYTGDAIVQIYNNIGIDTTRLKFNLYDIMPSMKDKENNNGSYNSYVDQPFYKDLSKRKLFTLRKNTVWGLGDSLYYSNFGYLWNGPFLTKNKNNEFQFHDDRIIRFKLDDIEELNTSPWLDRIRINHLQDNDNALAVLGTLLDNLYMFSIAKDRD